jgi:uncharacterized protein (TIGR02646 family)
MIHFNRSDRPSFLDSDTIRKAKEKIETMIKAGERAKSADFESHWLNDAIRMPVWKSQGRKCAYCERVRDPKREADIDHYRPKAEVTGRADHLGYWWLAYEWENYLFSCKTCNQEYKKNAFPIPDESQRALQPKDELAAEQPYLINPFDEDPEPNFAYDWVGGAGIFVKVLGVDEGGRGDSTQKSVGLNRTRLMEERAKFLPALENLQQSLTMALMQNNHKLIERYRRMVRELTREDRFFAGFSRYYFRACGLGEYVWSI